MKTTTISFVRSLIWWQHAMVAAVAGPTPTALFSLVDLEGAAVDVDVAREWVAFLARIAKANGAIAEEADARLGSNCVQASNRRTLVSAALEAQRHAEEHVAHLARA